MGTPCKGKCSAKCGESSGTPSGAGLAPSPQPWLPWGLSKVSRPGPLLTSGFLSAWLFLWDLLHHILCSGLLGLTTKGILVVCFPPAGSLEPLCGCRSQPCSPRTLTGCRPPSVTQLPQVFLGAQVLLLLGFVINPRLFSRLSWRPLPLEASVSLLPLLGTPHGEKLPISWGRASL